MQIVTLCAVQFELIYYFHRSVLLEYFGSMFEEIFDSCRTAFPFAAVLVFMPVVVLLVSPVDVANAAHEFSAYRTQQYDLHGSTHGNN